MENETIDGIIHMELTVNETKKKGVTHRLFKPTRIFLTVLLGEGPCVLYESWRIKKITASFAAGFSRK